MKKGAYSRYRAFVGYSEILLLIVSTFAFASLLSTSFVSAAWGIGLFSKSTASPANLPTQSTSLWSNAPLKGAGAKGTEVVAEGGPLQTLNDVWGGELFNEQGAVAGSVTPLGAIVSALAWAGVAYIATKMVSELFGANAKTSNALAAAFAAGAGAGRLTYFAVSHMPYFNTESLLGGAAQSGFIVGIGVAIVVFALTYKSEKKRTVELQCLPWEAPLGGADCEKCNGDPLKPCSEYRCKSLGQACDLVNKGTVEERCVWVSRGDVKSPIIGVWNNVLTSGHSYTPNNAIRPPNRGFKIVNNARPDGCIKPFTPLEFGIRLDEPAQCKLDTESGNKTFDEMQFYFGESNYYKYNHTQQLRLPSPDSVNAESPELPNEGNYNFYVRCRDANGNVNEDVFVINFCVDKSPDTTPPVVESTSITSGSPVQFGAQSVPFTLNINEPAECRWSPQDKDYSLMEYNLSCSSHVYELNAQQLYPCTTTLTGLQDRAENNFFFRCKDLPLKNESERNVNRESYPFMLRGSQVLSILSTGPNATLTGNTESVRVNLSVTTDDGSDEGRALCYFSSTGQEGSFVSMFETDSYQHTQLLNLGSGDYTYYFRCVDAGGNAAEANTRFSVRTDRAPPAVTRVYKESDALKLVTNENAECRYSLNNCNYVFEEGLPFTYLSSTDKKMHVLVWKPRQPHYIKCSDEYGNQPLPNTCTVTVNPLS
jgi:hypothetical protein